MTIKEALMQGKKFLTEKDIEDASLISRMLLSSMLNLKKEELIIKSEEQIQSRIEEEFLKRNRKDRRRIPNSIFNKF